MQSTDEPANLPEQTVSRSAGLDQELLESALDCIISMDEEGRVLEFNPAAEEVFGYRRADVLGKELATLIIPPAYLEQHRAGLKRYLETGEAKVLGRRLEIAALRADGSEILVELAITVLRRGETRTFTAYLRDITDRERGEKASRHLAAIIESSDDAIITKDLNGVITSWNASAERLFGYKPHEIIGRPVTTLIPLDRQHEEPRILHRIRSGERIDHYETVRVKKDGTEFDISVTVSPIKDRTGRIIGASKIARDISDRVQGERRRTAQYAVANLLAGSLSLAEAGPQILERISFIGKSVCGSIWLRDKQNEQLECAVTWSRDQSTLNAFTAATQALVLGWNEGLPGRVITEGRPVWIHDFPVGSHFARAKLAAAAGLRGAFAFPLKGHGQINGVLELFSAHPLDPDDDLLALVDALGSQIGLFVHRREIEAELKEQKEAAESANAAKDQFLATLSHELRTPLTPILIWAGGMVNDPSLPKEVDEGLQMVCRNIELEARLIDDLLDLTRIARGKLRLHLRKSDAHHLLKHAMEIVREEISSRNLKLLVELNATNHTVVADASRLQQVFWNVLKNASKFTPASGLVIVRTVNPEPDALHVEIADTGIGIEPEYLEKIFDAFEQVSARREGLGLGLAISKAIIEMHSGSIRAFSEGPGKGAKFVIDLKTAA